ncbi:MAG: VTT domain-containing protein [Candidatus Vogelbacteria bacterium]|nr:VTT domain-containing protein [Candidatus Vogelbacteria bacterium]
MEYLITLLYRYGYFILLPAAIFEGPIVTVVAGFLSTFSILNPVIVYITVIVGDIIGDSACYAIGWFKTGYIVSFITKVLRVRDEEIDRVRKYFNVHHRKAVAMSKLFHGVGVAGLITAGHIKVPFWRYIGTCFFVTLFQAAIFLLLGIFFGGSYLAINQYFNNFAAATVVGAFAVVVFFALKNLKFTAH